MSAHHFDHNTILGTFVNPFTSVPVGTVLFLVIKGNLIYLTSQVILQSDIAFVCYFNHMFVLFPRVPRPHQSLKSQKLSTLITTITVVVKPWQTLPTRQSTLAVYIDCLIVNVTNIHCCCFIRWFLFNIPFRSKLAPICILIQFSVVV